jgi:putative transposase
MLKLKLTNKTNRVVHAPQVLEAFTSVLRRYLPLELQSTRITEDDIWQVLSYATSHRTFIESACTELEDAPSGNRLREVLSAALPVPRDLQRQLNTALRAQLPRSLLKGKRSYALAIDVTLIPYHGQPQSAGDEVVRGEAKSGTTHFHGYATVSIVHSKRRYVIALIWVQLHDPMADIVGRLLDRVKRLKIRVRRVYLDKGFCAIQVFKTLDRRHIAYIVPIPAKGKGETAGVRKLFVGRRRSYATTYTFSSPENGTCTVPAVAVRRYAKGKYGRHGVRWFAYAVANLPERCTPGQVFQLYRQRFGIETSYRQMNQVRARTTSRNPTLRLLLVGIAFILVNLYVALRDRLTTAQPQRDATAMPYAWLSLRRIAFLLGRAIEKLLGVADVIQHRSSRSFS